MPTQEICIQDGIFIRAKRKKSGRPNVFYVYGREAVNFGLLRDTLEKN